MTRSLLAVVILLLGAGAYWLSRQPGGPVTVDTLTPPHLPGNTQGVVPVEARLVKPDEVVQTGRTQGEVQRAEAVPAADPLRLVPIHAVLIDGHRNEPAPFVTLQVIDPNGVEAIVTSDAEGRIRTADLVAAGAGEVRVVEGLGAPVYPKPPQSPGRRAFVGVRNTALLRSLRPRFSVAFGSGSNGPDEWRVESSRLVPLLLRGLPAHTVELNALFGLKSESSSYEFRALEPIGDIKDGHGRPIELGEIGRGAKHLLELRSVSTRELGEMVKSGPGRLSPTAGFRSKAELAGMSRWSAPRAHLSSKDRVCALIAESDTEFMVGKLEPRVLPLIGEAPLTASLEKVFEQDPVKVAKWLNERFPEHIATGILREWNRFRRGRKNAEMALSLPAINPWIGTIEGRVTSQSTKYDRSATMWLRAIESRDPAWRDYSARVSWQAGDGQTIGSYRFTGVPPGDFWIEAQPTGLEEASPPRQRVTVPLTDNIVRAEDVEVLDSEEREFLRVYINGLKRNQKTGAVIGVDATLTIQIQGAERIASRIFGSTEFDKAGSLMITDRLPQSAEFALELTSPGSMAIVLERGDFESVEGGHTAKVRFAPDPTYRRPMGLDDLESAVGRR